MHGNIFAVHGGKAGAYALHARCPAAHKLYGLGAACGGCFGRGRVFPGNKNQLVDHRVRIKRAHAAFQHRAPLKPAGELIKAHPARRARRHDHGGHGFVVQHRRRSLLKKCGKYILRSAFPKKAPRRRAAGSENKAFENLLFLMERP